MSSASEKERFLARAQQLTRCLLAANCTAADAGFLLQPCASDLTGDVRQYVPINRRLQSPRTVSQKTLLDMLRNASDDQLRLTQRIRDTAEKALDAARHTCLSVEELVPLK
jgi:hypothetical protein